MATGGTNYKSTAQSKTPYMDLYNAFKEQTETKGGEYKENLRKQADITKGQVEQEYGKGAEEQYVSLKQQQKQLPAQLRTMGLGGGAAESSLIKLKSAYGQGLGALQEAKGQELSDIERSYLSSVSDYNLAQKQNLEDAYADYMAKQVAYDQQIKEQELSDFLNTYQSTYTTPSSIDSAIANLQSSTDVNKDSKISYLQAHRNVLQQQIADAKADAKAASVRETRSVSKTIDDGTIDNEKEIDKYLGPASFTGASADAKKTTVKTEKPTTTTPSSSIGALPTDWSSSIGPLPIDWIGRNPITGKLQPKSTSSSSIGASADAYARKPKKTAQQLIYEQSSDFKQNLLR